MNIIDEQYSLTSQATVDTPECILYVGPSFCDAQVHLGGRGPFANEDTFHYWELKVHTQLTG